MNTKHTSYLAKSMTAAKCTVYHPKPYTYREQLSRGFVATTNPYEFNFRIAAYCDVFNLTYAELARRGQALSDANNWGIRLTRADIQNYVLCRCKPKSEKRFLIGRLIGVEEGWLAGYNKTINKEYLVESYMDDADDGPNGGSIVVPTRVNAIALMLKRAKEFEDELRGA